MKSFYIIEAQGYFGCEFGGSIFKFFGQFDREILFILMTFIKTLPLHKGYGNLRELIELETQVGWILLDDRRVISYKKIEILKNV